jgi:signal transduction histidine kinase
VTVRLGIRTRLTLLYGLLFLAAGAALLALNYGLLASRLPASNGHAELSKGAPPGSFAVCKQPAVTIPPAVIAKCKEAFAAGAAAASTSQRSQALRTLLTSSLIGLGILTVVSAWLGWVVSGRALRPIRRITQAAQHASELNLSERLALSGPEDELKELADTFDNMLAKLDAAFESQRRFVANAAHELRTPLTVIRTAIEVTLSKPTRTPEQLESMAAKISRSVQRAQATVDALLELATSQQSTTADDPVDLATAVEDALDAAGPAIAERQIELEASLEPAPTNGDRVLLERMVANLVDNSAQHNQPGGFIRVRTWQRDGEALLEIANSGPFVPAEAIPALTEPFGRARQRLDPTEGVGLGLSIANAIAVSHGAQPTISSRPAGGLLISIAFAAQAVPAAT